MRRRADEIAWKIPSTGKDKELVDGERFRGSPTAALMTYPGGIINDARDPHFVLSFGSPVPHFPT